MNPLRPSRSHLRKKSYILLHSHIRIHIPKLLPRIPCTILSISSSLFKKIYIKNKIQHIILRRHYHTILMIPFINHTLNSL
ncbi:hypothetical protein Hanom_Chr09g00849971 [Helianthus anomalus]